MENLFLYKKINSFIHSQLSIKIFEKYCSNIKWSKNGADTIIDIGCGPGEFIANIFYPKFSSKIHQIIATDKSAKMVTFASRSYSNNPKIKFDILDIEEEIPNQFRGYFDHVFSSFCIHWAKNQGKTLKNFHDLLKPGGDTLFWMVGAHPQICANYVEMATEPRWRKYMSNVKEGIPPYENEKFSEIALRKNLEDAGFKVNICENLPREMQFQDEQSFKDFLESINPFIQNMTQEVKRKYIDLFFEKVKKGDPVTKKNAPNTYFIDILVAYAYKKF